MLAQDISSCLPCFSFAGNVPPRPPLSSLFDDILQCIYLQKSQVTTVEKKLLGLNIKKGDTAGE